MIGSNFVQIGSNWIQNLNPFKKYIKENMAKMLEDFVDPISWFIGLSDFGHEGRYHNYSIHSAGQCGKFKFQGGTGFIL